MNRRSFIGGILAACVAPQVIAAKAADRVHWKTTQHNGLWVAEQEFMFSEKDFCGSWKFIVEQSLLENTGHRMIFSPAQK
jgi:hypothetical protein